MAFARSFNFFSVRRLHGFRQGVPQVCTCRKLIVRSLQSRRLRRLQKRASVDLYIVHLTVQAQQTTQKKKQTKTKTQPTKKTNKKKHNQKPRQLDSNVLLMNSDSSLCAIIRAGHLTSKDKTNKRARWPSEGAEATIHARKPRIPPARIPITTCNH